jgi:hypothetical protein
VHFVHSIDHHSLAAVSVAATCLDVLGTLYLAYDLLGGEHGPLRLLTRAVTYSIVFGIGYAIGLGFFFGVAAGVATGVTFAIELNRTARQGDHYSLPWEAFLARYAERVLRRDFTTWWGCDSWWRSEY